MSQLTAGLGERGGKVAFQLKMMHWPGGGYKAPLIQAVRHSNTLLPVVQSFYLPVWGRKGKLGKKKPDQVGLNINQGEREGHQYKTGFTLVTPTLNISD